MEKLKSRGVRTFLWGAVAFIPLLLLLGYCGKPRISLYIMNKDTIELETEGDYDNVTITASATHPQYVSWNVQPSKPNCIEQINVSRTRIKIKSINKKLCKVTVNVKMEGRGHKRTDSVSFSVVKPRIRGLKLDKEYIGLEETGEFTTEKVTSTIEPPYAAVKTLSWSTEDSNCIRIENNSSYTDNRDIAIREVHIEAFDKCDTKLIAQTNQENFEETVRIRVTKENKFKEDFVSATLDSTVTASGVDFPFTEDDTIFTLRKNFSIAKTEVTYELWRKVYDWATSTDLPAAQRYSFQHEGQKGSTGSKEGRFDQPVTNISWCDAMVWTNAYTEWTNIKGSSLSLVYMQNNNPTLPIRSSKSQDPNGIDYVVRNNCYMPYIDLSADGFRLPTSKEWEFVARLQNDSVNAIREQGTLALMQIEFVVGTGKRKFYFAKATNVSGSEKPYYDASTKNFAWFNGNSNGTHPWGTKAANALGLSDMSGNVWEWVSINGSKVKYYGGAWDSNAEYVTVSSSIKSTSSAQNKINFTQNNIGFRLAKNGIVSAR